MPRKPRMYLAGIPAHIVQRGNNRDACFYSDDDYLFNQGNQGESRGQIT